MAAELSAAIGGPNGPFTLGAQGELAALTWGIRGGQRQFVALEPREPSESGLAIGDAEEAMEQPLVAIARGMARPPGPDDGIDAATGRLLAANTEDWQNIVNRQNSAGGEAARLSGQSNLVVLAIALAAVAGAGAQVAGQLSSRGGASLVLLLSGVVLLAAVGVTGEALGL